MRTATATRSKSAPASRAKLSAKAKRPVKAKEAKETKEATLASAAPARSIGETAVPKGGVALKTLCAEIGINSKVARRELRKVRKLAIEEKEKNPLVKHALHTRWVFAKGDPQIAEIKKTLRAYVERNGTEEEE